MKQLFLYDFDGTITTRDSLFDVLKLSTTTIAYYKGLIVVMPRLLLMTLGVVSKSKTKEHLISYFFKGTHEVELQRIGNAYVKYANAQGILRPNALIKLKEDLKQGDVYIVSASLDFWLKPIAKHLNVNLICTEIEVVDGKFSGKFLTPNCNYNEKARRVKERINLAKYDCITYYGDSKGDLPMKPLVNLFHFRYFT